MLEEKGTKVSTSTVKQVLYRHNLKGNFGTEMLARSSHSELQLASCDDPGEKVQSLRLESGEWRKKNRSGILWFESRCPTQHEFSELQVS
jgi:hypothetical protein